MDPTRLLPEVQYQFARSGGKGGQNVNKVATKAELYFDVARSALLSEDEKATLLQKLAGKLTTEGVLVLYHQTERSQLANREKVTEKFLDLVRKAFVRPRPRKATKPGRAAQEERRSEKKRRSDVKEARRRIDY
ncbi:alternative ribosome rescue aminoacyl-tRNA hydrolase ArfB [Tellurirhabdus rosea]|uniref:alternative ribosome rescue aminoacyl-tRNA hydrolase ArfB n=1 Tax=Tellurirhabdus rosea TaxID=2674997 RepID=UPI002259F005|nr:alternative ribosome rescue aminoacyl-tRNA hydrolase ArfB [Tellurirhabdus rosea]